jgi:hypothetical protein
MMKEGIVVMMPHAKELLEVGVMPEADSPSQPQKELKCKTLVSDLQPPEV